MRLMPLLLILLLVQACKREPVSALRVGYPTMEERVDPCAAKVKWWADNETEPTTFRLRDAESSTYLVDTVLQTNSIELYGFVEPGRRYVYEVAQGEGAFEQEFRMRSIAEQYIVRRKVRVTYSDAHLPFYREGETYMKVYETADGLLMRLEAIPGITQPDLLPMQYSLSWSIGIEYEGGDSLYRTIANFDCTGSSFWANHLDNRLGDFKYWSIDLP
jgi:hypothetical protein